MSESDPITVFFKGGKWLVGYGSYLHGYYETRAEAIEAATEAARQESRELVVEGE